VFWEGPERRFAGWYVNIQEPFRRTDEGFDTQDLELDVWIPRGRAWQLKDDELLDVRVQEGRFTQDQARAARREADRITAELDAGRRWWDDAWVEWRPDVA
jgi:predicted RNA-binding protein associated with RNAse of E/G family